MVLQDYKIDGEYISISKKELEELRDHYGNIDKQTKRQPALFLRGYYSGKRDVCIDILKMFEPLMG